jgi:hypothetical protein
MAVGAILAAVAAGKLTVDEGDKLASIVHRKAETQHLRLIEERLAAVEAANNAKTLTYRRID